MFLQVLNPAAQVRSRLPHPAEALLVPIRQTRGVVDPMRANREHLRFVQFAIADKSRNG
jgi:hypothetical protein